MYYIRITFGIIFLYLISTFIISSSPLEKSDYTTEYSVNLYDSLRSRVIPLTIYTPKNTNKHTRVIIFSHGYEQNRGGSDKEYSHITRYLASQGYYVISVQHELPSDELLAMDGDFRITRLPNWEKGVSNILYTINEFRKLKPEFNWDEISLIGHSNGGDMSALFGTKYPQLIRKIILLDNRRMPLPRTFNPQIYSLRGSDYPADEGVIPSKEEQEKYCICVIYFNNIRHSEMDNKAYPFQSQIINNYIMQFLKDPLYK